MSASSAAHAWFIAGAVPLILAGALHVYLGLVDTVRPTYFAPIEASVRPGMEGTGMRLVRRARPSVWSVWLGIHISHGLGVFTFGLLCVLIAAYDFELVVRIDPLRPLTIAFSAAYLVLSLRFWYSVPVLITGTSTACFSVATLLSL